MTKGTSLMRMAKRFVAPSCMLHGEVMRCSVGQKELLNKWEKIKKNAISNQLLRLMRRLSSPLERVR